MAKRSKKPADLNSLAAAIVGQATDTDEHEGDPYKGKDPAAVESGRKGGQKGGEERAKRLTKRERSEIAKRAADRRWRAS